MNDNSLNSILNCTPVIDCEFTVKKFNNNSSLLTLQNTSRYFKVSDHLVFILGLIDGKRSIKTITDQFNLKFTLHLSYDEVFHIIEDKLIRSIQKANSTEKEIPSYLKLSTIVINKKQVHFLSSIFYKLFNKKVAIIGTLIPLILLSFFSYKYFDELQLSLDSYPIHFIYYFILIMMFSTIFHEIGHAAACRAMGTDHGGIGIGFYLLSPVMFADVTAAWELPIKERLIVNLGGIYFEILFCSLLIFLFILTGNLFFINTCLIMAIMLLYNLNPFFRTDGYWVLSDYLDISNLRQQSNLRIRNLIYKIKILEKIDYNFKDWFLIFYSLISYGVIAAFLYYVIFYDIQSLIYLPQNICLLIKNILTNEIHSILNLLERFGAIMIPLFFYYLLFKRILIPFSKKAKLKLSA